ncbi:MAG: OmpA family protein [Zetaproteobacteria bacterium]|nr:OmpA family protein [Zetaproteobacteria bacterium]
MQINPNNRPIKQIIALFICLISAFTQAQKNYYFDWRDHKVTIPLGPLAFADKLVGATPGEPAASRFFTKEDYIIGQPDSNMYALGYGASVTVQFTDNALIDVAGSDLYIFEVGGTFEPTQVEISKDGKDWINVGIVNEISASVDISAFVQAYDKFYFVRITDLMTNYKPNKRFGADIDAIAALGSLDMSSPCEEVNNYFTKSIESWSAKGMFETTLEYQNRLKDSLAIVTNQYKYQAIQSVANKRAILKYADFSYNADSSQVTINTPNIDNLTFNLERQNAKAFYKNINNLEIADPDFEVDCANGKFVINKAVLKNVNTSIAYAAPNFYQNGMRIGYQVTDTKNQNNSQIIANQTTINDKIQTNIRQEPINKEDVTKVLKVEKSADFDSKTIKSNQLKIGQRFALPNLYFEPDSYALTREAKRTLMELFKFLKQNPEVKIEVGGHTNTLPPDNYAQELSTNRAKNVAYFLFDRGIAKSQISYQGYGKNRPIDTSNTNQANILNQRVEIKVMAIQ